MSPTAVIESDDVESDADEGDPAAFNLLIAGATISEIEVDAGGIITKIELAANSDYGEAEDGETEEDDS